MQACHWSHVHGINKDTNKAGVYHNPMIILIYEDVRMRSAKKIRSTFPKKRNGRAFNLAAFLGDIKLLWITEATVFFSITMAEFERELKFERNSYLKIHFTDKQMTEATGVIKLQESSSLVKRPNNDIPLWQKGRAAALHHNTDRWNLDSHKIHCRQHRHKGLLYHKSQLRPPCYQTTPSHS